LPKYTGKNPTPLPLSLQEERGKRSWGYGGENNVFSKYGGRIKISPRSPFLYRKKGVKRSWGYGGENNVH